MPLSSRRTSPISLVISPGVITAVQARHERGRLAVTLRGAVETPPGAVKGAMVEDPVRVGQAIRGLWRSLGLKEREAAVLLPSSGYLVRTLRLPDVPEGERRAIVRGELEHSQAVPRGGGKFDFLWVSRPSGSGNPQADVYAYYTTDLVVDSLHAAVRHADLQLAAVEPEATALFRAALLGMGRAQPAALLAPADKHSDLCIHDGRELRHLRRIPAGWTDLEPEQPNTDAGRRWSAPEHGSAYSGGTIFLGEGTAGEASAPEGRERVSATEREEYVHHDASFFTTEVARTLAFYTREHGDDQRPQSLLVIGPPERAYQCALLLSGTQPLPVSAPDLVRALDLPNPSLPAGDREGWEMSLLGAYGLAAGVAGGEQPIPALNIVGERETRREASLPSGILAKALAGSAAAVCAAAIGGAVLGGMERSTQRETARVDRQIAAIKVQWAPIMNRRRLAEAVGVQRRRSEIPAEAVLGRVAAAFNPGLALTSLQVSSDGKVMLEGEATRSESIQQFTARLGEGSSIHSPMIDQIRQNGPDRLIFRVSGTTRAVPPSAPPAPEAK